MATAAVSTRLARHLAPLAYGAVAASLLLTCSPRTSLLQRVQASGVLKVASVYGRPTCYAGGEGLAGYECDLVRDLAESLGVHAEVSFHHSPAQALEAVLAGRADLAAAGLTAAAGGGRARFAMPIDRVGAQLVHRIGTRAPASPAELDGRLVVAGGTDYAARLAALRGSFPSLRWEVANDRDAEDLLLEVAKGSLDYTVASSSLLAIQQRYYPQLRVAFDVGSYEDVAFAFASGDDLSLHAAAQAFLKSLSASTLARLHDRYYGHVEEVDYYSAVALSQHLRARLPRYVGAFKRSAERHELDWRLLAAVGYQESHWDPTAVSPTGVRGLMMLTHDTAQRYEVGNRENAVESIEGGARVLADLYRLLPADIREPDRSWMVLAAYNQGPGHLYDARALAAERGGDPNRWLDVRDTFPLLTRPRWHLRSRHGYVRGGEVVDFVANVRSYYDLITWLTSGAPQLPPPMLKLDPSLRTAGGGAGPATTRTDAPGQVVSREASVAVPTEADAANIADAGADFGGELPLSVSGTLTESLAVPEAKAITPALSAEPASSIDVNPKTPRVKESGSAVSTGATTGTGASP